MVCYSSDFRQEARGEVIAWLTEKKQEMARDPSPTVIIFFSPLGAKGLLTEQFPFDANELQSRRVLLGAIGPTTARAIEQKGYAVAFVAREPTPDAVRDAVNRALHQT